MTVDPCLMFNTVSVTKGWMTLKPFKIETFKKLPSHISRGIGVLLDANLCLYNYLIIMKSQVGAVGVCSCHNN